MKLKNCSHNYKNGCSIENVVLVKEIVYGGHSGFVFECNMCLLRSTVWSEPCREGEMDVNTAAVAEVMTSRGVEVTCLNQMCTKTYEENIDKLRKAWEDALVEGLKFAVAEEREMAIQQDNVDNEVEPLLTVVKNGSCVKCSYHTNYNGLSGVGSTSQDAEHVSIPPPSTSAAVSFLAPPSLADGKDDNLSAQEQVTQELWDNQQAILREIQSTHTPTDAESESFADYNYDNSSAADQAETFGLSAADHCQAEALGLSLPDHGQAEGSMSDAMERPGGVMSDSLELFGRYVASILRQLPITTSYSLQQKFINEAISARLEYEGNGHSPTPGSPTAPRSQPARSKVNVDATAVSDKTSTNKSSKKRDKVHKTLASNEPQQITSVIIKQEVLDDADISEAVEENTSCHMVDDSSSGIDIEEGPLKQEVQSDFEVLCKDPQTPSLEVNSLKLLQALAGETSRKAQDSTPQPLLTCSFCGSKFFKTSDLNQHLRDKHGGGPSVGHKPIKEGTCAKRPRLTSSANQNNVSVTQTPGDITESLIQTLATTSAPTAVTVPSYTSSVNPPVFVPFRNYSAPVSLSNQPTAPGTKAPHVFDDRPS